MVSVKVSAAGKAVSLAKGLPITVEIEGKTTKEATVGEVKDAIQAKFPRFTASRQKISLMDDKKALSDETTLEMAGLAEGGELAVKDLGPQISWRTVFLIEYVGPLIIHPIFYRFPHLIYGTTVQHSDIQKLGYAMVMFHFLKRELETVFVHRFSHATMPFRNVFKNSFHYHVLSGLLLAWPLYGPAYSDSSLLVKNTQRSDQTFLLACAGAFLFAELSNLKTHLTFRSLRTPGTRERKIPFGYGFNLVSCPNYLFETLAWTAFMVMTGNWQSLLFLIVSTVQMFAWAKKKHRQYKTEFGADYPRGRMSMFPFIA